MENNKLDIVFLLATIGLLFGAYSGVTTFLICLVVILLRAITTDKITVGFFLLLYAGPFAGITRTAFPSIPVYGLMLQALSLYLLKDFIAAFFTQMRRSLLYMTAILMVFVLAYFIGNVGTTYATNKIWAIIMQGYLMLFAYFVYDRTNRFSPTRLMQLMLLTSIAMFVFSHEQYGLNLGGMFEYGAYRESCTIFGRQTNYEEQLLTDYQGIGVNVAFALSLFFAKNRISKVELLAYSLIGVQLLLTTSARQALLAFVVVMALRYYLGKSEGRKVNIGAILGVGLIFMVSLWVLQAFGGEVVNKTLEQGDEGRSIRYALAVSLWQNNPLFGVGIGGFSKNVGFANYPHNMFLEILCECGIIGLLLVLVITYVYIKRSRITLLHKTNCGSYMIVFMSSLFVRVMVSADLTTSIELISAIFAVSTTVFISNPKQNEYNKKSIL